jgi:hypothetical protein
MIGIHHEASKHTKEEETGSRLLILDNLKQTPNGLSVRPFVDFGKRQAKLGGSG